MPFLRAIEMPVKINERQSPPLIVAAVYDRC